jgi:redox-sensitive bicupin YhaK (pirin superfamily)
MVGPFILFDQVGPAEFLLGAGMDVRPHPHIGLSTVSYLFPGRDHAPGLAWNGAADPTR